MPGSYNTSTDGYDNAKSYHTINWARTMVQGSRTTVNMGGHSFTTRKRSTPTVVLYAPFVSDNKNKINYGDGDAVRTISATFAGETSISCATSQSFGESQVHYHFTADAELDVSTR